MDTQTKDMVEVMEKTKELLTEKGWVKRHLAVDALARPVPETSEDAVAFCILGGLYRAAYDLGQGSASLAMVKLDNILGWDDHCVSFNNAKETTLDDILGLLDKGIAKAKESANV